MSAVLNSTIEEIKDIVAYIKFIYNPSDSQSLQRIINVPKRSIGSATVDKLISIFEKSGDNFLEILQNINDYEDFSQSVKQKLSVFYNIILDCQSAYYKMDLPSFISYILDKTSYIKDIQENEDESTAETRIDNLQEFISVAKEFVPQDSDILGEFLSQVS